MGGEGRNRDIIDPGKEKRGGGGERKERERGGTKELDNRVNNLPFFLCHEYPA